MKRPTLMSLLATCVLSLPTIAVAGALAPAAGAAEDGADLYLVTLDGPGVAGDRTRVPSMLRTVQMKADQNTVLRSVEAPRPTYTWTYALNGFAVDLTEQQADDLAADPRVALVEPNSVRPLASTSSLQAEAMAGSAASSVSSPGQGGEGTVIGFVDSGLAPENPVFTDVPGLGRRPVDFKGRCEDGAPGENWNSEVCDGKVVAARWFVQGFGQDDLRTSSSLSPRDTDGHGTQMASIAAGNPGVSVRVGDQRLGNFGGAAPQARLAIYKACWTAPDPDDDGCATADLVSAIDQATRDGVDVLNLSVGGPSGFDTVERALLGAAEADIVVTAAGGNTGSSEYAAHPGPWVTTVGGTQTSERRGRVVQLGENGKQLEGAMSSTTGLPAAPIVAAADARARGASLARARACAPQSLDAAAVAGRIVVCERGLMGRIDKSAAVALAGGVGMVLVNLKPQSVDADLHRVPTVHLNASAGRALSAWMSSQPQPRVELRPLGLVREQPVVPDWSAVGDPNGGVLKPDLVAPANGVLGAVPSGPEGISWDFVSGTSAAAAHTAGVAARLISQRGFDAAQTRSALVTTAAPLAGTSPLRSGSGLIKPKKVETPGLAYDVDRFAYREWLTGEREELNTPSILLNGNQTEATRSITNLSNRALFFSSRAVGFRRQVRVTPAAVRLGPGESAEFTLTTQGAGNRSDDGYVVWRGARGTTTRIPVLITR